jgi:colanic acid biosynthesis glycosyl transferase WcaI
MSPSNRGKTLLVLSQVFVPDPASVGQHMADVAFEMAARGHRVVVYTSARGYEDPTVKYPKRETVRGVEIRRLGFAHFGKKRLRTRAVGTLSFLIQATVVALTTRNLGGIFFSTSPPLVGVAALVGRLFRRVPVAYWAMDLNPDQLIAMKAIKPTSLAAHVLETGNRWILKASSLVVALDRFMADRLRHRVADIDRKMLVMPPWPHEAHLEPLPHEQNPFRAKHDLADKFVVMYSGNHSLANPLRTLLHAAKHYKDHPRLRFLFVGGGLGKKEVEAFTREHGLTNVVSLPYQPLADLRYSLGAADVHVVSLGNDMVGIVHPCKIYGAMTVGRPILFLGPRPSHIADILDENPIGRQVSHGDVEGAVSAIESFLNAPPEELRRMGDSAQRVLGERFTQAHLCGKFCDALEQAMGMSPSQPFTSTPAAAATTTRTTTNASTDQRSAIDATTTTTKSTNPVPAAS